MLNRNASPFVKAAILIPSLLRASTLHAEWTPHPAAVQTIYQTAVPHTDRTGKLLTKYTPGASFFPRVLYHALEGEVHSRTYHFTDYAKAGFNACHLWEGLDPTKVADAAQAANIQLIIHNPRAEQVKALRDHPAILAWYLDEEPIGRYWGSGMEEAFAGFQESRAAIKKLDPEHPVFALDAPWIMEPARSWWIKWATAGDVTSHDNYPLNQNRHSLSFENGVPETVSLAVSSVEQKKPMWLCGPAFESPGDRFTFTMPDSRQLRSIAYTAIVHGATGVMHFALDSWVTRNGNCVGIAPDPQTTYGQDLVATADQLRLSRDLWNAAAALNAELKELEPALLSPTARLEYKISLDPAWPPVTKEPVRTLLKTHPAGGYVLLVVNIDAAPQHLRIDLPEPLAATQLFEAKGAGRFTQPDSKTIELYTTPSDVRVIRLTPTTK